ncbi:UDP-N-acetylmuramoyl-L-alanine--D-glutamate ligase [Nocardioides sp.]|uniref:UDP-N-acetylmuramoyl-L-alanine--D-glutamate ligase n=1 Tax=Nocardioides sp. TaxID=35761 RepID=UPI0035185036
MRSEDLRGLDVVIWGAGREGRAAHAWLAGLGIAAEIVVTGPGAPAGSAERLLRADVVVKSPGVPHTAPEFLAVRAAGVRVTSLTDLWLSAQAARVLAVTGTKGKSTTSAAAHHLLDGVGVAASLVGNGGTPVTEDDAGSAEVAVAEVSSYQAADLTVSPRLAVVTSLYPEHLPWHGGYEQYVADKLNLVAHGPALVVVPSHEGEVAERVRERIDARTRLLAPGDLGIVVDDGLHWHGVGFLTPDRIGLAGAHNHLNLALALTVVAAGFDVPAGSRPTLLAAAGAFAPLAHRLEPVPSDDGRRWVDDSLATAPEAVVAALATFPGTRVTLLLGGSDRGLAYDPLRAYLAGRDDVEVLALGPAGARWIAEGGADAAPTTATASFAEACALARTRDTEVVLLAPGAPSFDEFASYEERAAAFRAAARA